MFAAIYRITDRVVAVGTVCVVVGVLLVAHGIDRLRAVVRTTLVRRQSWTPVLADFRLRQARLALCRVSARNPRLAVESETSVESLALWSERLR